MAKGEIVLARFGSGEGVKRQRRESQVELGIAPDQKITAKSFHDARNVTEGLSSPGEDRGRARSHLMQLALHPGCTPNVNARCWSSDVCRRRARRCAIGGVVMYRDAVRQILQNRVCRNDIAPSSWLPAPTCVSMVPKTWLYRDVACSWQMPEGRRSCRMRRVTLAAACRGSSTRRLRGPKSVSTRNA